MSKGIRLFRVLGIEISLDYTWFIVFALFGWSLAYGYFPNYYPGLGRPTYLFMGFVSALLLFGCVLIHELSHSYTANRLGLDIKRITLFIFGGVAELTREPDTPVMELKIAIAGPIASGVLAGIFRALSLAIPVETYPVAYAITAYLSMINVVLLIFNMIPALPLDGGRILRALWWAKTGDLNASTKVASMAGRGFAMLLIGLGFFQMMMGNLIGGFWAIIIGFFLQQAAISSYTELLFKDTLDKVLVGDIMSSPAISIRGDCTLAAAVDQYFFTHHYVGFPVTEGGGVVGILTLGDARAIDKERWAETLVRDAMTKLEPEELLQTGESAIDALKKLSAKNIGRGPVMEGGRLTGMLSRGDIMRVVELKTIKKA